MFNVPLKAVYPTKIIRTLILPQRFFQDGLLCTLMILAPLTYILEPTTFPKQIFEKI